MRACRRSTACTRWRCAAGCFVRCVCGPGASDAAHGDYLMAIWIPVLVAARGSTGAWFLRAAAAVASPPVATLLRRAACGAPGVLQRAVLAVFASPGDELTPVVRPARAGRRRHGTLPVVQRRCDARRGEACTGASPRRAWRRRTGSLSVAVLAALGACVADASRRGRSQSVLGFVADVAGANGGSGGGGGSPAVRPPPATPAPCWRPHLPRCGPPPRAARQAVPRDAHTARRGLKEPVGHCDPCLTRLRTPRCPQDAALSTAKANLRLLLRDRAGKPLSIAQLPDGASRARATRQSLAAWSLRGAAGSVGAPRGARGRATHAPPPRHTQSINAALASPSGRRSSSAAAGAAAHQSRWRPRCETSFQKV